MSTTAGGRGMVRMERMMLRMMMMVMVVMVLVVVLTCKPSSYQSASIPTKMNKFHSRFFLPPVDRLSSGMSLLSEEVTVVNRL